MISVGDRFKNIVGNEENAGYQYFLFFPQCFQKLVIRVIKTGGCMAKAYEDYYTIIVNPIKVTNLSLCSFPNKPCFYVSAVQVF